MRYAPLITLLLVVAVSALAGEVVTIDGVPHIQNSAEPDDGVRTLALEEIWRAGHEDDERFFGLISAVRCSDDGTIYVLDSQLCQVHAYTPDGEFLRSFFRRGEGPGEVNAPRDMALFDDGRLGLIQEFPARMTLVDRTGLPAGTWRPGGNDPAQMKDYSAVSCCAGHGMVIMTGTHVPPRDNPAVQPRINFLASFADDGRELARLSELPTVFNFEDMVFKEREHMPVFWWGACIGTDGLVYGVPERQPYAVHVWQPDGALVRVIERAYTPYQRNAAEKQQLQETIDAALSTMPIPYRTAIEAFEPDIETLQRGLRPQADGSLWALSSRGVHANPDGIMATFDVYDPQGHFVEQVQIKAPGSAARDGIFFPTPDRVVVVKGYVDALAAQFGNGSTRQQDDDDDATMQVIGYRVIGG